LKAVCQQSRARTGVSLAVVISTTAGRGDPALVVSATMELLGERNWWRPGWLQRITPGLNVEPLPDPQKELVPEAT
jgi:uncharacterized membrane protein YdfJ with MMPL/SSD domain